MPSWQERPRALAGPPRLSLLVMVLGLGTLSAAAQLASSRVQLAATYLTAGAALAVGGAVTVRRRAPWSTGWPAVLLGCATTVLAILAWTATTWPRPLVVGTVVAGVALALTGYVQLVRSQASHHHALVVQIDAAVLTVGVAYLAWVHLLQPLIAHEEATPTGVTVYGTFLVAALVGFFLGARLVLDRPATATALYLAAVPVLPTVGGVLAVHSGAVAGDPLVGWAAAANFGTCVLLASAAVLPREASAKDRRGAGGLLRIRGPGWVSLVVAVPVLSVVADPDPQSRVDELLLLGAVTVMAALITLRVDVVVRERDTSLRALDQLAHHDSLTGLANRRAALEALEQAVAESRTVRCLAYIDLVDFKSINDTYGHEVGDRVLVEVAAVLGAQARPGDSVARIGGDEFLLLTASVVSERQAEGLRARLATAVSATRVPVRGELLTIAAHVGIALTGPRSTVKGLLVAADLSMYADRALRQARDQARAFNS